MLEGVGSAGNPAYVDQTKIKAPQQKQTTELESNATNQEQKARDQAATANGLLESPAQDIIAPDKATIKQLEASDAQQQLTNANGLGKTAVSSYQSLASAEFSEQMSNKIKVDIKA